jgi:alkaline phosphatase D
VSFERRQFLKTGLFFGTGLTLGGLSSFSAQAQGMVPFNAPPYGLPVVQLYTDETRAQFRVLSNPLMPVEYEATTSDGKVLPLKVLHTTECPYDEYVQMDHLLVEGLSLGKDYLLSAYDLRTGARVEERVFNALDTKKKQARVVVASCMCDIFDGIQADMWKGVAAAKPDVIFLVGDTSYTDLGGDGTLQGNWTRHIQTRRKLDMFKWRKLVPTFATWDDHDYAGNNADKNHPLNGKSINVFKAMFGWTPRLATDHGPGVAMHVDLFNQRYYLMDDRSFRDAPDVANGTHWGDSQEQWVMKHLSGAKTPSWLFNGGQFFGGYLGKDSFEGTHMTQFKRVLQTLKQIEAPVIFGSGDVHFSEAMKIEQALLGYETFELTSSSIHSMTTPLIDKRATNKRRLDSTWHHNFMVIDSASNGSQVNFRARACGAKLQAYFDVKGSVKR